MERELSLHVPARARASVAKAMRAHQARQLTLRALYFDTSSRTLAQAGMALRVRREGRRWVQTLKARGTDPLTRIELNHPRSQATLDLSLYDEGPLAGFFAQLDEPLVLRYETRVKRRWVQVAQSDSQIEIAYDDGAIHAQGWALPISEIEFELMSGRMDAVFEMSSEWLARHGLVLETRSKAERGDRLAALAPCPPESGQAKQAGTPPAMLFPARKAGKALLAPGMTAAQGYAACAGDCLLQMAANAALLAGVDSADAPVQSQATATHQLRVGIRRLRSCWKLFEGLVPAVEPDLAQVLKAYFATLGDARNQDVIQLHIEPRLTQAGMPELTPAASRQPPPTVSMHETARSVAFQSLLLALLQHVVRVADSNPADPPKGKKKRKAPKAADSPPLAAVLPQRLDDWWRRSLKRGRRFNELSIDQQHALRKRVKLMRYSLEFCSNLLPDREARALSTALGHLQDVLGDLNDFYLAEAHYRGMQASGASWFAVGWLRAMQSHQVDLAQVAFAELHAARCKRQKKAARLAS